MLTSLFYRLPRLTALTTIVILISGLFAILTLGRQEDPSLVERYGYILTTLPGADAERIEATITEPIEKALKELSSDLVEVRSISRANVSQVSIQMNDSLSVTEVDNTWARIRQEMVAAQANLPQQASTPLVVRNFVGANTMIVALQWEGEGEGEPQLSVMSRLAEQLKDRFLNLNATQDAFTYGQPVEEVRVIMDPEALAASGLSLGQTAQIIAASDAKVPAGQLRSQSSTLGLEIDGAFESVARVRSVPLLQRPDGSALLVSDVGQVLKGLEDPATRLAISDSKRAIMVGAFVENNTRMDIWADRARTMVEDFRSEVSPDINVEIIFDQSGYTIGRLEALATNLIYSSLIVFCVLFLVMGWRAALVVGTALPLTIALVLMLFSMFDMPLHQMSVTGLVISLGLLIDNAIVVVDEYEQERQSGYDIVGALQHSLSKLTGPLFASTLTTSLAFAPITLAGGGTSEFIGMMAVSVIFSVSMSLLVAVTIIPALAAYLDAGEIDPDRPYRFWRDGLKFSVLTDGYRWSIELVLRNPVIGIFIGLAPVLLSIEMATGSVFGFANGLPSQFFPPVERDQFQVEITLPQEATINDAIDATERANALLKSYPEVVSTHFTLGEPGPRVYYNAFNLSQGVAGFASGYVQAKSAKDARAIVGRVQSDLRDALPTAQVLATPFEQGPPAPAPIAFYIEGEDLETLNRLGNEARRILAETPGVTFTSARMRLGAPVVRLEADEAATAMSGQRLTGLANDIRAELEGLPAGSILEGIQELPVRVIAPGDRRGDLNDLRSKTVSNGPNGAGTPLSALGDITLNPQAASIIRLNGQRVNEIYAFIKPFYLPTPINEDFKAQLEASDFELPAGYRIIEAGGASNQAEAVQNLVAIAVPLLLIMVGAIALVFNSFRLSFLIMLVGGMSMGLALGGVWMFNLPIGFTGIVGALGLLGVAINGAIVVLSLLKGNPECRADNIIAQRETVVAATRHIVATTLTTMGGFVPIILTGDAFWMPLAAGVSGGVAGAALLSLYFVPAVYRIMTMRPLTKLWRLISRRAGPDPAPAE